MSETLGLALGCLMAMVLFLYTFWPENAFASQRQKTRLDYLEERKEQLYENLRDLNFEYRAGKYPEEDFLAQRAQLENETAQLLAEMEHLQQHSLEIRDKDSDKDHEIDEDFFACGRCELSFCRRTGAGRTVDGNGNKQDHRQAGGG